MQLFGVLLCALQIFAAPRSHGKGKDGQLQPEAIGNGPSNSFYDHLMGNLKKTNEYVHLASLPHGIPPPLEDDYDESPVPIFNYAFINPALNGEKTPHWTDTLQNFKNNPAISPEVKNKVVNSLQSPIKIYGDGTESRFPLLVEYFVQRIQKYFSHYVYEDMSRPASWDVKPNASDSKPVSSEKEPVDAAKIELTTAMGTTADDIDYIVDFTSQPHMEEDGQLEPTDEDFEKTTEEWEAPNIASAEILSTGNGNNGSAVVIVEKEILDLKVIEPIELDDKTFIYVGDGTGDELTRSNKRKKLKKKKRN